MKSRIIMAIIVCILIFLTGCSDSSKKNRPSVVLDNDYFQETLKVNVQIIMSPEKRYKNIEDWHAYLLDTFNLDLQLDYSSNIYDILNAKDYQEGLIYISSYEMLNELVENNLLKPIDSTNFSGYLNNFSEKQKYSYSKDGNLYAIPIDSSFSMVYRYYMADFTQGFDISSIDTISEFYEIAQHMTYEDPDGNGVDDTYAIQLNIQYAHIFIDDIYKGYGCYFNRNGGAISYNPNTQKIENVAYTENIEECLNFLKNLKDEKIIDLKWYYNPEYHLNTAARYEHLGSFRYKELGDIYI